VQAFYRHSFPFLRHFKELHKVGKSFSPPRFILNCPLLLKLNALACPLGYESQGTTNSCTYYPYYGSPERTSHERQDTLVSASLSAHSEDGDGEMSVGHVWRLTRGSGLPADPVLTARFLIEHCTRGQAAASGRPGRSACGAGGRPSGA
jgi:hypothetical protein